MIRKIYGAPGTGKTTRMLDLLEQESANVELKRIAFVTHSVAAKQEVLSRIGQYDIENLRYFKTIHGICYGQLGLASREVMQKKDYVDKCW